ncbi:hypothetical protein JCM17961_36920 [Endothiovibrio diazotrophicus]
MSGFSMDKVLLLFLAFLFALISPVNRWWAADGAPWYAPFLLWFGVIVLAAWLYRRPESP